MANVSRYRIYIYNVTVHVRQLWVMFLYGAHPEFQQQYTSQPNQSFIELTLVVNIYNVAMQSPRSWLSFGKGFSVSSAGSPLPSPVSRSVASRQSSETASPTSPPGLSVFKSLGSPGSPVGVVGGVEKDTDDLFCSHTVLEIKKIEQQTRLDIDRRKEDLRQMVG